MTQSLITRLSKLDAPDREVDGIIAETFGYPQEVFGSSFGTAYVDGPDMHYDAATWSGEGKSWSAPYFTSSVDAAIALAERVLPGWQGLHLSAEWTGIKHPGNGVTHSAQLWESLHGYKYVNGKGANLAIALLIALLRAKEASHAE